jgi:hypothetical protein
MFAVKFQFRHGRPIHAVAFEWAAGFSGGKIHRINFRREAFIRKQKKPPKTQLIVIRRESVIVKPVRDVALQRPTAADGDGTRRCLIRRQGCVVRHFGKGLIKHRTRPALRRSLGQKGGKRFCHLNRCRFGKRKWRQGCV